MVILLAKKKIKMKKIEIGKNGKEVIKKYKRETLNQ
jgi:hypothetical protein